MWSAVEVDAPGVPSRYRWIVNYDDGMGRTETIKINNDCWMGLTRDHAEDLAEKLNGYIHRETIELATIKPKKESN